LSARAGASILDPMCGVCGIVDFRHEPAVSRETVARMCGLLRHRGADEGTYFSARAGLGHRRLKITDLITGQQPMPNEDRSVWVVFNGEIYNYESLRAKLEALGHVFRSQTDTEVIPHLYEEYGDDFVSHLEGNWAIALWDEVRERLVLTRDRIGKRPLVWMCSGRVARFASEVKALFADPEVPRELDPRGMMDVIHNGHVTESNTMFRGISMVLPGTILVIENGEVSSEAAYWDFATEPPYAGSLDDAREEFCEILSNVTRDRLIGDVPYGLMLSSGIDSSLVASFIVEHVPSLKTYTVARGGRDDEVEKAGLMAQHIGSDHHVFDLADADVPFITGRIPWMFDQPFFNDASVANYLVAQSIAGDLTVAITGDGGDSAFSGTTRHLGDAVAARVQRAAPVAAVRAGVGALNAAGRAFGSHEVVRKASLVMRAAQVDEDRRWLALNQQNLPIRHRDLLATPYWRQNGYDPDAAILAYYRRCDSSDHLNRVLYSEIKYQLPPNDLLKVDRSFMYNTVAGRAPLLDRRVIEFAASLPAEWKRRGNTCKWFLREVARTRIPAELVGQRKVGLSVPLRSWLRGSLGAKVERVVASERFARRGIYNQAGALAAIDAHRRGRADFGYAIWTMAMTELWHRMFIDTFAEPDERIWDS
jgi:asparagine synthase (glutamine-hydrolysing)